MPLSKVYQKCLTRPASPADVTSVRIRPSCLHRREPQRTHVREHVNCEQRRGRVALPAHMPHPLRRVDVHERRMDGGETAAQIARVPLLLRMPMR